MNTHKVRKVRRQTRPGYPTRPEVVRDPELLRRHVPSAWKKSAQVTAALSIMLASARAQDGSQKERPAKVAPLFEHGEGRATEGCVAINPPKYLTEDEALRIISEELAKTKLTFSIRDETLPEAKIHHGDYWDYHTPTGLGVKIPAADVPLKVDFMDKDRRVAVKFVSCSEYYALGGEFGYSSSTVDELDFKKVVRSMAAGIADSDKTSGRYYGLFYEPAVYAAKTPYTNMCQDDSDQEKRRIMTERAEADKQAWEDRDRQAFDLLRAQVKDFIEWLKGQGAI